MSESGEFINLFSDTVSRRSWLLFKALECLPLDRAIDLARTADEFIAGGASTQRRDAPAPSELAVASPSDENEPRAAYSAHNMPTVREAAQPAPGRLALSAEVRDRLVDRLTMGARNAELAVEFGLSSKQVQGVRIGCARKIAKRRSERENEQPLLQSPTIAASADDVVRYLRQQDDVVVPQAGGDFLVNARFRLPLPELVNRANRMRARQGKPEFDLGNAQPTGTDTLQSANGHRLHLSERDRSIGI